MQQRLSKELFLRTIHENGLDSVGIIFTHQISIAVMIGHDICTKSYIFK